MSLIFNCFGTFGHFLPYNLSTTLLLFRRVSILLEAQQETELPLVLSYVVTGASWSPLYDIRAFSKDNSLQVTHANFAFYIFRMHFICIIKLLSFLHFTRLLQSSK